MQFEAVSRPLQEILIVGQHVIPRYQRRYAWDELNIEEFWNDLRSNQQGHFLGSMVVCGPRSGEMEIIDGQQRITTALILLSVLRDEYIRLEETALVGGIEPLIKYVDLNGKERFRLENRDSSANDRLVESVLTPEKNVSTQMDSTLTRLKLRLGISLRRSFMLNRRGLATRFQY